MTALGSWVGKQRNPEKYGHLAQLTWSQILDGIDISDTRLRADSKGAHHLSLERLAAARSRLCLSLDGPLKFIPRYLATLGKGDTNVKWTSPCFVSNVASVTQWDAQGIEIEMDHTERNGTCTEWVLYMG